MSANYFNTYYVNKYGIAYSCDIYPDKLKSDLSQINENDYKGIKNFDTVYVISSALKDWFKKVYPEIKKSKLKIILVTGDSIVGTPLAALSISKNLVKEIRNDGIILHWFCQNCDIRWNSYITPIPLGIDYHTINRQSYWGEMRTHYITQELILNSNSMNRFEDFNTRKYSLFCDIHLNKYVYNQDRRDAFQSISKIKNSYTLKKRIPRYQYWKEMKKCNYILAPKGRGLDTHRIWEAFVLGVVPIVMKSSIDKIFSGLPILTVDCYNEVSQSLISEYQLPKTIDLRKLTLQYWVELIERKKDVAKSNQKNVINIKTSKIESYYSKDRYFKSEESLYYSYLRKLQSKPTLLFTIIFQLIRNLIFYPIMFFINRSKSVVRKFLCRK